MKNTKSYLTFLFFLLLGEPIFAQNTLSLQQAFELALQQNYSIQIASNELEIAKKNNVMGNAGMLPVLTGTMNQDNQIQDTKQEFLGGNKNNKNGARSNQLNGGVEMSWTLFNGMKMFASKSRLAELEAMGELKLRQQMENTLSKVAKSYMDLLLVREQLQSAKSFIAISDKRLEIAKAKVLAGKSSKSEVLNAQVNVNSDLAAYKKLETNYRNSKLSLNQLLGKDIDFTFEPSDSLEPKEKMALEELRNLARKNNTGLRMAEVNKEIALLQMREIKGERYPVFQVKGGYLFNQQQSQAGFLQSSNTNGVHYGAGLNLNIFNGYDVNRRVHNAKLSYRNTDLLLKDSLLKLDIALAQAYNVYLTNIDLFHFEENNLDVARQNFEISQAQQEQGMISSNDLRIAQVNYLQNVNRLLQAAYDAMLSEIELKRLSGSLLK